MKDNFHTIEEKLEKTRQHVSLSAIEKSRIRARLIASMSSPQPFWSHLIHMHVVKFTVVPLLIIFIIFGGVTTASAQALPGDVLYALKTTVYEPVRGLAFRGEESVQYQKELAERRLAELVELSAKGEVSEDIQQVVFEKFDVHIRKAEEQAGDLSIGSVVAVQSELESELRAHERVFAELNRFDVREKIQNRVTAVVKARASSENTLAFEGGDLEDVAQKKKEEATQEIALAESQLEDADNERIALQTHVQVDLAEQSLKEGDMSLEAGSFAQAIVRYEKAKRFAREADRVFTLTNRLAVAPADIDREEAELLREKTKAPVAEVMLLATQENASFETSTVMAEPQNIYEYFQTALQTYTQGTATADVYRSIFVGLKPEDFNGVVAHGGIYQVHDGEVEFVPTIDFQDGIAPETIEYEGHIRLLVNIATRLRIELSSIESVDFVMGQLFRQKETDVLIPTMEEDSSATDVLQEQDLELPLKLL